MIPQAAALTGSDDRFQQNNQVNEAPELNYQISEVNNRNECIPQNSQKFWQSPVDQESAYYRCLYFQTNKLKSPMGNNALVNQQQNIGNLHNSKHHTIPAYNVQHNRDNLISVDPQNNLFSSQLETKLPAAARSPHQHREITIPLSHYRPQLITRTLANVPLKANSNAFPIVSQNCTGVLNATVPASANTVGGTMYYLNPFSSAIIGYRASQSRLHLCCQYAQPFRLRSRTIEIPHPMQHPCLPHAPKSQQVTEKDLAKILSFNRKDPVPEWKLSQYNGHPLQWHKMYSQFRIAIDSQTLTEDLKLT